MFYMRFHSRLYIAKNNAGACKSKWQGARCSLFHRFLVVSRYVAFLAERKSKSFGTAHKDGIGWKLYVPRMNNKLDSAAAEREPDIFPADVRPVGAC